MVRIMKEKYKTMLYATLLVLAVLYLLSGCGPSREEYEQMKKDNLGYINNRDTPYGISVQVIDGCEYIYCDNGHGAAIVHKQNCKNTHGNTN